MTCSIRRQCEPSIRSGLLEPHRHPTESSRGDAGTRHAEGGLSMTWVLLFAGLVEIAMALALKQAQGPSSGRASSA